MLLGWLTIAGLFDDHEAVEDPEQLKDALWAEVSEEEIIAVGVVTARRLSDAGRYTHFRSPMSFLEVWGTS